MNEKESALKRFVSDGWLSEAPGLEDHYTLGVSSTFQSSTHNGLPISVDSSFARICHPPSNSLPVQNP